MKYQFLLISLSIFWITLSNAQFTEEYFHDNHSDYSNITGFFNDMSSTYYYGESLDDGQLKWFIRKIDLQGNILWSINDVGINGDFILGMNKASLLDDGYIYAIESGYLGNNQSTLNIIKIDPQNGNVIYTQPLLAENTSISYIIDLTATHFMVVHDGDTYLVIDRITGNIDSSGLLNNNNSSSFYKMKIASDGTHLFVSFNNNLTKKPINDLDNNEWSIQVTPDDLNGGDLKYDSDTDELYFFGNTDNDDGRIMKLDKITGGVIWDILIEPGGVIDQKFAKTIIIGNYIYTTMDHAYVGSGDYYLTVAKINKNTGGVLWQNNMTYVDGGFKEQDVVSIVLDDNDDLYISGYYNEYNHNQSVLKVDGGTGTKVWDLNILSENNKGDKNSDIHINPQGELISIADNANEGSYLYTESWIRINQNTGEILEEKELGGFSDISSEVLAINSLPDDNYILALKEGNVFKVTRKDILGNIIWEKTPAVNGIIEDVIIEQVEDTAYLFTRKARNFDPLDFYTEDVFIVKMNLTDGSSIYIQQSNNFSPTTYEEPLEIKDTYYDPASNRVFAVGKGDEDYFLKTTTYDQPSFSTNDVTPLNFSGYPILWINALPKMDNRLIHPISNTDSLLLITGSNIRPFYMEGNNTSTYWGDEIGIYSGINYASLGLSNGKILIVGKMPNSNDNGFIKLFNPSSQTVEYNLGDFYGGTMVAVEADVNPNNAFVLSSNADTTVIRKINANTGVVEWETLAWTSSNGESFKPYQMLYNPILDKIALAGQLENLGNGETKAFIQILESDGTVLQQIIKQGINPVGNFCSKIDYFQTSGDFIFGGALSINTNASDGFVYTMRGDALNGSFIDGVIYRDENNNGIKDASEYNVQIGKILKNSDIVYTNTNGEFTEVLEEGVTHNFTYEPDPNWELVTTPSTYTFTTPISIDTSMQFGIKAINTESKLEVFLVSEPVICNEDSRLSIMVKNTGTEIENCELIVNYSDFFSLYDVSEMPVFSTDSSIVFYLDSLLPGNNIYITADFYNPNQESVGTSLPFYATVEYDTNGQPDTSDFLINELILCSYDPNDKQVVPEGVGDNDYTLIGERLYYTIRFQNTGNYPARDVVVTDEVDMDLNLETFQLIGTSHPLTRIRQEGRLLNFEFIDIYLLDSIANEPESHGYIMYSIEHNQGIPENTLIENTANIYFDLNPAIVTNTTKNQMVTSIFPTSVEEYQDEINLLLSPNPSNGEFQLSLDSSLELNGNYNILIYDSQGRRIQSHSLKRITNQEQYHFKVDTKGIYWIELVNNDSKLNLAREKLIVH